MSAVRNSILQFRTEILWRFIPSIQISGLYPLLVPEWQTGWATCLFQSDISLTPGLYVKAWWTCYSHWRIFILMKSVGQNLNLQLMKEIAYLSLLYSSGSVDKYKYKKLFYIIYSILILHTCIVINLRACQNTASLAIFHIVNHEG